VHSLTSDDFEQRDAEAATDFGHVAADAGVRQIIYLGGLGDVDDNLSPHLRSRRDVEQLLGLGGVPVTVLRAAVVIGHGGISWEITRQLVDHLPAMITPRWVSTRTQPIALTDVIRYLTGVLDNPDAIGQVFEVGGPEILTYADMMRRAARIQNHRSPPILPVPLLTPRLSSMWLALITDVDQATARNLIDSMNNEVIVQDDSIRRLLPGELTGYDDAVRTALRDRADDSTVNDPAPGVEATPPAAATPAATTPAATTPAATTPAATTPATTTPAATTPAATATRTGGNAAQGDGRTDPAGRPTRAS
jgi:uncharacterized protein YbjT (DUF2867 family)